MVHLDTSFLVDLLRETGRQRPGPAVQLLESMPDTSIYVSIHAVCELEAGAALSDDPEAERHRLRTLTSRVEIVRPTHPDFTATYGELLADLQRSGRKIGTMDLLIATAALVAGAPLVTRDLRHFERVRGLELLTYGD
ncbi:MAG TPA: type II toxin-antitoxin system VapC family toxin [Thermoanaerobaculia bacterium]|nr:type II toxin-antitoxin system VapC family toxin [Thermoanaerobaculia bacterium]